jgi:hypothetical protein
VSSDVSSSDVSAVRPPRRGRAERSVRVLRDLARPATPADRRRERLVAGAVAGCGVFLLAAFAILTVRDEAAGVVRVGPNAWSGVAESQQELAPYLAEPGLRGGTALGAVLLVVPFALLAVQALRTGTAARERRLAALSLAGATRGQVRRIARWEGTRAAVLGGLAAAPAYLALWLVVGAALPGSMRLLPRPVPELVGVWVAAVAVLAAAGAVSAMLAARPASVTPLGITRRAPRALGHSRRPLLAAAVGALAIGVSLLSGPPSRSGIGLLVVLAAVVFLFGFGGAPLVQAVARRAAERDLVSAMAAHRLLADVRTPGRVAGVLLAVGLTVGLVVSLSTSLVLEVPLDDLAFYFGGLGLAGLGALLACVVATSSLVVAATEQVLDGRRGIAVLVALAASPDVVLRVVRRQLALTAVPPMVVGGLLGSLFPSQRDLGSAVFVATTLLGVVVGVATAGAVAFVASSVAAQAVRPAVLEASNPENLRAP